MANQICSQSEYVEEEFSDLKFTEATTRGKEFYDCTFTDCTLSETTFYGCKFDGCHFKSCDLSLAKVTNSIFIDVHFTQCQCIGINWTEADWSQLGIVAPLNFQDSAVSHSIFMGLTLKKVTLTKCMAENADFSEADLTEANCSHTNFLSARFLQTNLTKTNFENASNYAIDVNQNTIKQARFSLPEAISLLKGLDIVLSD